MKIVLEKEVMIEKYQVLMDIEVEKDRPEVLAWLKVIKEGNELNNDVILYFQEKIFFESQKPKQFIKNILQELVVLGFLDEKFNLTQKGLTALEEGTVFIPQSGIYELLVINDPLFPQVILDYKEFKPDLHEEKKQWKNNPGSVNYENTTIPSFISKCKEFGPIRPLKNSGETLIRIFNIKKVGKKEKFQKKTKVRMDIGEMTQISLKIEYNKKFHFLEPPRDIDKIKLVESILRKLPYPVDEDVYSILINFDETTPKERKTFSKNFSLIKETLLNLGKFESIKLIDVPILPSSFDSAKKWAKELIKNEINTFLTPNEFDLISKEITHKEEFAMFNLPDISIDEMLLEASFGSQVFWFLKAPRDLKLEKVISK
ncbi:MAG: hypothetical protein ACTSUC_16160 [Promethearchaeota archaeon]